MPPSTAKTAPRQPLGNISNNSTVSAPADVDKPTPPSKKRKADEPRGEIDIDDERCQEVNISCNAVRNQIRKFLESGEMKVGEFQKAIGASSSTYNNFMRQNGPYKGANSMVYQNAFAFFKHRQLNGIKPAKKAKTTAVDESKYDVSGIQLEGDDGEHEVEVYDTCDSARKHIREHLSKSGVTQASFARQLATSYHDGRKITSAQLNSFLSKKGACGGNTSAVFYASYVYFEKLRIKNNKPKSDFRKTMEKIYSGKGFDTKTLNQRYWVGPGERVHENKFGEVSFH